MKLFLLVVYVGFPVSQRAVEGKVAGSVLVSDDDRLLWEIVVFEEVGQVEVGQGYFIALSLALKLLVALLGVGDGGLEGLKEGAEGSEGGGEVVVFARFDLTEQSDVQIDSLLHVSTRFVKKNGIFYSLYASETRN